jgi:hypothetical protein
MSIGSMGGVFGSAAGAPLAQTKGSESERAQRESAAQQRTADTSQAAEKAEGIGQTDEDQETSERDADGRRLWERTGDRTSDTDDASDTKDDRKAKDLTGTAGTQLDLTG